MKYKCFRCGYISNHKGNFENHLNRKKICFSSLCDISIENIKKYYNIISIEKSSKTPPKSSKIPPKSSRNPPKLSHIRECLYCNKKFTRSDNLNRHYNICKIKKEHDKNMESIENIKNTKIRLLEKDKKNLINTVEKLLIECSEMKKIIISNQD